MAVLLRLLKYLGLLVLALIVLYAIGRPTQKWLDDFYSGVREPYLQMLSSGAVTLRWQSEKEYAGVVRYGLKPDQLTTIQKEMETGEEHEIRLSGLMPATKYFYSAGDGVKSNFNGNDFWFKTAPLAKTDSQKSVRFWVTGDQGYPNIIQTQVRDAMLAWLKQNPRSSNKLPALDFWLTTGDNAYRSGSNEQFQAGFFAPYKTILRNTPVWPVYGNHDSRRWVFFDIFSFPAKAESGGVASGSEHYYSFDYANIHFVMLDTQDSSLDIDGKMLSWLKRDLQQTKQQWLITFFHHPPYTKGTHDSDNKSDSGGRLQKVRENILPILERAGVDLVFSGHSHMYERSELINCHYGESSTFKKSMIRTTNNKYKKKANGIMGNSGTIYTVIGSSSKVDVGPLNHPAMPHSLQEAGSMIFDVNNNKLKAYFINKSGKVKDQFEIVKGVVAGVESQECK
ncbi:MAG: hypothetical protein BMS9Abin31_0990 [Gammaproteobacteria bacterium]|nr:MAG: hypothetical protein BMS9Abin31_0990 [Gammaproteobacteria bacterium]